MLGNNKDVPGALSEFEICAEIMASGLFDAQYYLDKYPDVVASGMDPIWHYVRFGEKEGRQPSQFFDPKREAPYYPGARCMLLAHARATSRRQKEVIPIAFAVNDNYVPYFGVAFSSLLRHASPAFDYHVYVLHNGLDESRLLRLMEICPPYVSLRPLHVGQLMKKISRAHAFGHFSIETYFRLLIPRIFIEYNKVLYLDSDIVILDDIANLYNHPMTDKVLAAVHDQFPDTDYVKKLKESLPDEIFNDYYNAGVLVIDIEKFNEGGYFNKCMALISSGKKFICVDQDILNIACAGKIKEVDLKWNMQWQWVAKYSFKKLNRDDFIKYALNFSSPAIIHFSSDVKPWKVHDGYFANIFWKYAKDSPFFEEIKKECPYNLDRILEELKNL